MLTIKDNMTDEEINEIFETLNNENDIIATYGVKYLDDRLKGISRGDLVLIGARSGAGKSTLAEMIAKHNANNGIKVTLFSLENFNGDSLLTEAYYQYKKLAGEKAKFLDLRIFVTGKFNKNEELYMQAKRNACKQFKNINLVTRTTDYTRQQLKEDIFQAFNERKTDLIIIDHVDYLDKNDNESEIEHITSLMKEIRETQFAFKIPVICISHLRKTSNWDVKIPSIDEFIGSSNKAKIATTVIVFAPDDESNAQNINHNEKSTWCCIRKKRMGGIDNTCARLMFNKQTGTYNADYECHRVNFSGTKTELLQRDWNTYYY